MAYWFFTEVQDLFFPSSNRWRSGRFKASMPCRISFGFLRFSAAASCLGTGYHGPAVIAADQPMIQTGISISMTASRDNASLVAVLSVLAALSSLCCHPASCDPSVTVQKSPDGQYTARIEEFAGCPLAVNTSITRVVVFDRSAHWFKSSPVFEGLYLAGISAEWSSATTLVLSYEMFVDATTGRDLSFVSNQTGAAHGRVAVHYIRKNRAVDGISSLSRR